MRLGYNKKEKEQKNQLPYRLLVIKAGLGLLKHLAGYLSSAKGIILKWKQRLNS